MVMGKSFLGMACGKTISTRNGYGLVFLGKACGKAKEAFHIWRRLKKLISRRHLTESSREPMHSLFKYVSPPENSHTSHEIIWNRAIDSSPQKTKRPSCISLIKPSTSLFTKFGSATTRVFNPKQEKLEAGGHTWASCSLTFSASRHRNLSTFYRHLCLKSSSFWSGYQLGNHVSCRDSLQESLKDPHEAISGRYF